MMDLSVNRSIIYVRGNMISSKFAILSICHTKFALIWTNSLVQCLPWKVDIHSDGQEIFPPFIKPEGSLLCSQNPSLDLSWASWIQFTTLHPQSPKISFNVIRKCMPGSLNRSLPFRFYSKNLVYPMPIHLHGVLLN